MFCPLTVQLVCTETIILLHGGNFELKFYLINLALFFCSSEACRWVGMASGFVGGSGLQESLWAVQEICPWIKWGSRGLRGWVFLIFFHKWAEGCSPEAVCPSWRLLPPPLPRNLVLQQ